MRKLDVDKAISACKMQDPNWLFFLKFLFSKIWYKWIQPLFNKMARYAIINFGSVI